MQNYSKLRCPISIYQELEFFLPHGKRHFLTYEPIEEISITNLNLNNSFETVSKYTAKNGGQVVYGVSILESDIIFEAETFAVWEAPDKTLHHITSKYNKDILFIPNENPYEIPDDTRGRFKNLFFNKKDKCIKTFIDTKLHFQSFVNKINPKLTKPQAEIVKHYRDLSGLIYNTNNDIERNQELKNLILERNKSILLNLD